MEYLNKLLELIPTLEVDQDEDIIPYSLEEIQELESSINKKLPLAFKEFLLICGNGLGEYLHYGLGSEVDTYVELQDFAKKFFYSYGDEKYSSENVFVLFFDEESLAGFTFFNLNDGDNPTVYWADMEGVGEEIVDIYEMGVMFSNKNSSFSEFVINVIMENT